MSSKTSKIAKCIANKTNDAECINTVGNKGYTVYSSYNDYFNSVIKPTLNVIQGNCIKDVNMIQHPEYIYDLKDMCIKSEGYNYIEKSIKIDKEEKCVIVISGYSLVYFGDDYIRLGVSNIDADVIRYGIERVINNIDYDDYDSTIRSIVANAICNNIMVSGNIDGMDVRNITKIIGIISVSIECCYNCDSVLDLIRNDYKPQKCYDTNIEDMIFHECYYSIGSIITIDNVYRPLFTIDLTNKDN